MATIRDTSDGSEFTTIGPDAGAYERYAQVDLEDGSVLLYDREIETAWITSDTVVALTETA